MLHYVWWYSSSHWKELQSLHTDNNTAPHPRRNRSSAQRKGMGYHTIPLHTHKKVMVKKSYHDLQRQTFRYKRMIMICRENLRYKWMIMICRDRSSGTNGCSWSAETEPQVQIDDHEHDLQRQTLRCKLTIMICRDRPSSTCGWSWSWSADREP
jgi:hypothetical protein